MFVAVFYCYIYPPRTEHTYTHIRILERQWHKITNIALLSRTCPVPHPSLGPTSFPLSSQLFQPCSSHPHPLDVCSYVDFSFAFLSTSYKWEQTMYEFWPSLIGLLSFHAVGSALSSNRASQQPWVLERASTHSLFQGSLDYSWPSFLSCEFKDKLVKCHKKPCWYCNYNYIDSEFNWAGLTGEAWSF